MSAPAELCADRRLHENDFCMPVEQIEGWLKRGDFVITDAAVTATGTTAPHKLRLRAVDERGRPVTFSVKFKPVPEELDSFNNSPRRELAAYQVQKLFLDPDEYVVPPTVIRCIDVTRNRIEGLEPFGDTHCALGVMAYWLENITDEDVYDKDRLERDARYRHHLGNLNALTILIGHQDSIGSNFIVAEDRKHPRVFSIDNGLAFGAMGANPVQLWSSVWSGVRVKAIPARTVKRLRELDRRKLETLAVVAQLELKGNDIVEVPPTAPFDPNEGVRRRGRTIQLGLTAKEITSMHERLAGLLGELESGELESAPAPKPQTKR